MMEWEKVTAFNYKFTGAFRFCISLNLKTKQWHLIVNDDFSFHVPSIERGQELAKNIMECHSDSFDEETPPCIKCGEPWDGKHCDHE